ncbi:hypothetical protein GCM10022297_08000 [Lactobacillus hamsteri]|uniref:Gram-positive cocci surface proteins LPxTG domain-containing protein n=1 Tax=Lactobacillus hamsteri DSM 5661 = JCM 6256 TaxID=1423754 RepID=A0A0R1YE33_9LACO|nr:BspA family leucine-rich repeat surface protein [Lactobacillus hamsteri]KRM40511.1 hypothetical protein FC39_GL000534 [Lactobacillus hamsteri DSM 5661 = JCM 6256]
MKKLRANFENKPHYSIRKLSVGVTSVIVGLSFFGFTSNVVKADDQAASTVEKREQHPEQSTVTSNTDKVEGNAAEKQAQNTVDIDTASLDTDTTHVKASLNEVNDEKIAKETSKTTVNLNSEKKSQSVQVKEQSTTEVNKDKSNVKPDDSSTKAKNPESDSTLQNVPANVNDWQYNTDNNQDINLTDYIGKDKLHIVIPNDQDFIQAGKLHEGHKVKITSAVMYNIIVKKQPQSVVISKNNNGKVVASDHDWSNAFGGKLSDTRFGVSGTDPKLEVLDVTNLDTHNITNFSQMFYYCDNLKTIGDLSNWDVSNGTNFVRMFKNASSLITIGDLSNWNVSNGTDFTGMFNQARHIEKLGDLAHWNVGKSKSFDNMFRDTWNLHDIGDVSDWNVANSKSFQWMFGNSALDRINISGWDLRNATNFSNMFQGEPFKEVKNPANGLWVPQTVHHDKIVIANDIKLPANAAKIITDHDFAGGNSHQFVITNNDVLLNIKVANISNDINVMDKQNDILFAFVMPSFFKINDMNHLEDEIKAQILQRLKEQIADYNSTNDDRGILSWSDDQIKGLISPITNKLTISDNKEIGTLTLTTKNGDKVEDMTVPVIWNLSQVEKNVTRKVIARLPNGEEKLLKTQVVRYYREVEWDKLLIDTPIEFTPWEVVPGTLDFWKQLILTDEPYTPTEEEKNITEVVNTAIPGYIFDPNNVKTVDENLNSDDNSVTVDWSQKVGPDKRNEYIYINYTAKKYHANFKYVTDSDRWYYPKYQKNNVEETYDEIITVPDQYKTLPKFFKDKHFKLSYIEYEGHHYQPADLTKLKYSFTKDTDFIYHLVPTASVITYKDVTGLDKKDYDSQGVVITASVMNNLNVDTNPKNENGKWDYDTNGWTYVSSRSPNKTNLTVYLKAKDKSINRTIKYVDKNGNKLLPNESALIFVTHKVGEFEKDLRPKYEGNLGENSIFNIPSKKEINGQTSYFDGNNSYFATNAEKNHQKIADNGITVNKLAKTILVNVPETIEDGTSYTFVLPYVQSHINVIYKDVTGVNDDLYKEQAKVIEGHEKSIVYTDQPGMPFLNTNGWNYEQDNWVVASTTERPRIFVGQGGKYNQDYVIYLKHGTESVVKTVTETIQYQLSDGTKLPGLTYENSVTLNGTRDKVTKAVSYDEQSFPAVSIPVKKGYTATVDGQPVTEIAEIDVDGTTTDIVKTVTYTPDAQEAMVEYIDDTDHKVIAQSPILSGVTDGTINYNTNQTIEALMNEGYVLVPNSDETKIRSMKFDNDDNSDQLFRVHFIHAIKQVNRTDDVKKTIHYVYENGKQAQSNNAQTVHFTESGIEDLVTGKTKWTNATSQNFADVSTPKIEGYTPDQTNVAGQTVNFGDKDIHVTVTYKADPQTAHVIFRDDDLGTDLEKQDMHGVTDSNIDFSNAQNSFNEYLLSRGFEFVNLADETASRNNALDIQDQFVTADKDKAMSFTSKFGNPKYEQFFVVHLRHTKQSAMVQYVDDTENKVISTSGMLNGKSGEQIDYSTVNTIDQLIGKGYELVSDATNGTPIILDQDSNSDQVYLVHLKHGIRPTKPGDKNKDGSDIVLTGKATAIIHYVDENGIKVADDKVQTIHFKRTGKTDAVTGEVIELNPWIADKSFISIKSADVPGYTAGKKEILPATPMEPEEKAQEYTVVYTENTPDSDGPQNGNNGDDGDIDDNGGSPTGDPSSENEPGTDVPTWVKNSEEKDTYVEKHKDSKPVYEDNKTVAKQIKKVAADAKRSVRGGDVIGKTETVNKHVVLDKVHPVHFTDKEQAELPQTSEKQNKLGLIGLVFASIAGLFGLAGNRKQRK